MRIGPLTVLLVILAVSGRSAYVSAPALKDGVISYVSERGLRSQIHVGGPCADLWVSPDGGAIAFIRIDRSQPDDFAIEPFVEESTVFVA
jgi:hypothetical protein